MALAALAEAVAQRAVGNVWATGRGVDQHRLPRRSVGLDAEVLGGHELVGHPRAVLLAQLHEVGKVGVLLHVLDEAGDLSVDEELLEEHVSHRHPECAVGTGVGAEPLVGELGVVGVVGADHDDLLAAVPRLGHEVGVRRPGDRDVRPPHDEVAGVEPVGRLGDVGLVAEHLRRRDGQVGVPVVEREHGAADAC